MLKLWNALMAVADAVQGIATSLTAMRATIDQANQHARERLGLEAPALLEAPEEPTKGRRGK